MDKYLHYVEVTLDIGSEITEHCADYNTLPFIIIKC